MSFLYNVFYFVDLTMLRQYKNFNVINADGIVSNEIGHEKYITKMMFLNCIFIVIFESADLFYVIVFRHLTLFVYVYHFSFERRD